MNTDLYNKLPDRTESTPEAPFDLFDNGEELWICHHDSSDGQLCVAYRPQAPDDYYYTDQRIGYKHARIIGHMICRYLNKHAEEIAAELQKEIKESEYPCKTKNN